MSLVRQSQTAVLERGARLDGELSTEPFEVAWASEARWFVQFLEPPGDEPVDLVVQVSPDGLLWTDHESAPSTVCAERLATVTVSSFGHWLRLSLRRRAGSPGPLVKVVLALKE